MLRRAILFILLIYASYLVIPFLNINSSSVLYPKIFEIISHPENYNQKLVQVSGKALVSFFLVSGYYFLSDDKNNIVLIKPKNKLPVEGEIIQIKGKVHRLVKIDNVELTLIEEI